MPQCDITSHPLGRQEYKTMENNKGWWGCGVIGTLIHCWWEWKMVQPLWETAWCFLNKLNLELPYDPAILRLGMYPKELKAGFKQKVVHEPS